MQSLHCNPTTLHPPTPPPKKKREKKIKMMARGSYPLSQKVLAQPKSFVKRIQKI